MKKFTMFFLFIFFLIGCNVDVETVNVNADFSVAPTEPQNVNAVSKNGMITVTWDNVSNAKSYNVCYSVTKGVHDTCLQNVVSPLNHVVINNDKNYYIVKSKNSVGESGDSLEVSATAGIIDNNNGSITIVTDGLTWSKCSQTNIYGGNAYDSTNNDCSFGIPSKMNYCPTNYNCDNTIKLVASTSEIYNSCYVSNLAGGGWRVPTADEMLSLHNSYLKEPGMWPGLINDYYWSTNAYLSSWNGYFLINIVGGSYLQAPGNSQAYKGYVLCVK